MRIDIPYSLMIRDGALAWSTGQCPLDATGAVVHPDNFVLQIEYVCGLIEQTLSAAKTPAIARMTVYYVDQSVEAVTTALEVLRSHFGVRPLVTFVQIPGFYYSGMRVEIDVHSTTSDLNAYRLVNEAGGAYADVVEGDELIWVNVTFANSKSAQSQLTWLVRALAERGIDRENMWADHWYARGEQAEALLLIADEERLNTDAKAAVVSPIADGLLAAGELTFVKGPVELIRLETSHIGTADLELRGRVINDFFFVRARCRTGTLGNVGEMRQLMQAIAAWMKRENLSFAEVCKATTFYVGGGSATELHDNMAVRNAHYSVPGPASTGIPVRPFIGVTNHVVTSLIGRKTRNPDGGDTADTQTERHH